jgi:pilus assembly protein CpaF
MRRIETLSLMADIDLPLAAIRDQLADAVHLIVHQSRTPTGTRTITTISEVLRVASGPATHDIYSSSRSPAWHRPTSPSLTTLTPPTATP